MRALPGSLTLLLLLLLAAPVWAEGEADRTNAIAAADKLRAELPPPAPNKAFSFEGDIVVQGLWAGTVRYDAKAKRSLGKVVWDVAEDTFLDFGGAERTTKSRYHLRADLSLVSGSTTVTVEGVSRTLAYSRTPEGFRLVLTSDKGGAPEVHAHAAPANATFGVGTILLLLRAIPSQSRATYALPWFPAMTIAAGDLITGLTAPDAGWITAQGPTRYEGKPEPRDSWAALVRTHAEATYYLDSKTRTLIGTLRPQVAIVPKGAGGERLELEAEEPAATWKQAFLKFGFGYHMAERNLLAAAFHWPTMYDYETNVAKSWPKEKPVDVFREAWIQEFVNNSKRRTRFDTQRLLSMTLATGKVTKETEDEVVFAAHKNFGGGTQRTYTLKKIDGTWYLVRVEF